MFRYVSNKYCFSVAPEQIDRVVDDSRKKEDRIFVLQMLFSDVAHQVAYSVKEAEEKEKREILKENGKEKVEILKENEKEKIEILRENGREKIEILKENGREKIEILKENEKEKIALVKLNEQLTAESKKRLNQVLHAQGRLNLRGAVGIK